MTFLELLKEKFYILEDTNLYKVSVSLYFGNRKKQSIIILRNLSNDEIDKIEDAKNSRLNSAAYFYVTKVDSSRPFDIDKELYLFKYKTKKDKKDYNGILVYISKDQYSTIERTIKEKSIPEEQYEIKELSIDDVINLFLGKKLSSGIEIYKVSDIVDLSTAIDRLATIVAIQKRKEKKKKQIDVGTKKPDIPEDPVRQEEIKKENLVGADFFYKDTNKNTYSKLLDYHRQLKITTKSIKDRKKDQENRDLYISKFVKLIKEYVENYSDSDILKRYDIDSDQIERLLLNHIKSKLSDYTSLYGKIESQYTGKEFTIEPEKKISKQKKSPKEKTETFYIEFFNSDGDAVQKKEKYTEKEAEEVAAKAKENYKEYISDKKDFDKWDLNPDRNKKPYEYTDKMKNPIKYGILSISKTDKKVLEMSATGGGAAPGTGAFVSSGEGEGVASKYAFAKTPKINRKKFDFKNEAKMIFWESIRGLLKNQ